MPPVGKIAQLPEDLRAWLHQAFVSRAFGDIVAITEQLNALMKEAGVAISIGKSAVGAESQRIRRAQEAIRATTEAARILADTSPDIGDDRSAGTIALVQSQAFDLMLELQEAADTEDKDERLDRLAKGALMMSRLSRARVNQSKWNEEVKTKAKAAADKVVSIAKKGGLDAAAIREIRSSIMGVVKRDAAQP